MKLWTFIFILCAVLVVTIWVGAYPLLSTEISLFGEKQQNEPPSHTKEITRIIQARQQALTVADTDPFGDDDTVRVLLLGLDARAGESAAHCDAIQFIEIQRNTQQIRITAVPRGTYAPLPGTGHAPNAYYISNACAIGGLEYGIAHIEKILGTQTDFVVFVGFSQAMGVLRLLRLPPTETLQWLRHRQGYAIGEPQRARNHSTFLKQLLMQYVPTDSSAVDTALQYLLYKSIKTDLSFDQVKQIVQAVGLINPAAHTERVHIGMRPAYRVQDIPYDPETLGAFFTQRLAPIAPQLSKEDYQGADTQDIQTKLIAMIEGEIHNSAFVTWAYEHQLWLQIQDDALRESLQYQLIAAHVSLLPAKEAENVLADYILEMRHRALPAWEAKARTLLDTRMSREPAVSSFD